MFYNPSCLSRSITKWFCTMFIGIWMDCTKVTCLLFIRKTFWKTKCDILNLFSSFKYSCALRHPSQLLNTCPYLTWIPSCHKRSKPRYRKSVIVHFLFMVHFLVAGVRSSSSISSFHNPLCSIFHERRHLSVQKAVYYNHPVLLSQGYQ